MIVSRAEFAKMVGAPTRSVASACAAGRSLHAACVGKKIDANHVAAKLWQLSYNTSGDRPGAVSRRNAITQRAHDVLVEEPDISDVRLAKILKVTTDEVAKTKKKLIEIQGDRDYFVVAHALHLDPCISQNSVRKLLACGSARARKVLDIAKNPNDFRERIPVPAQEDPTPPLVPTQDSGDLEGVADLTLRELVARHGSDERFYKWLQSLNMIEGITEKRLKNQASKGRLVSRELVKETLIEPLDAAHRSLLSDGARTLAKRVPAIAAGGASAAEIEIEISKTITRFLAPARKGVDKKWR